MTESIVDKSNPFEKYFLVNFGVGQESYSS